MSGIDVEGVPEDAHAALRGRAQDAGMSVPEYVLAHLSSEPRTSSLDDVLDRVDEQTGGEVSLEEMTRLVRAERDAH